MHCDFCSPCTHACTNLARPHSLGPYAHAKEVAGIDMDAYANKSAVSFRIVQAAKGGEFSSYCLRRGVEIKGIKVSSYRWCPHCSGMPAVTTHTHPCMLACMPDTHLDRSSRSLPV